MNGIEQRNHKTALAQLQQDVAATIEAALVAVDERLEAAAQTQREMARVETTQRAGELLHLRGIALIQGDAIEATQRELREGRARFVGWRGAWARLRWLATGR